MTKEEALAFDLALAAFVRAERDGYWSRDTAIAVEAIKQARSAPVREDWGPGPHEVHSLPPAAPVQEPVFKPCSCRWKGEEQVQQCTLHAAHIEAIHEWAERAKTAEAKLKEKTNEQ